LIQCWVPVHGCSSCVSSYTLEDSQEDDDIEKYNPGELIGDISDDGDNHDDDKHEKPKSSDKTDLKGTSDLELGRTQRKSCSPNIG
jgi:hypothetical protein